MISPMPQPLPKDKAALGEQWLAELENIGRWWLTHALDEDRGGFYGEITADNTPVPDAPKGLVMNARILWFFSEAAQYTGNRNYRTAADRAFRYLQDYFYDAEYGGYYWSLNADGSVCYDKKQVYAQSFVIYGFSAYYQLSGDDKALRAAMACFDLIEQHCIDVEGEGYFEAYTREWGKIDDVRLSEKDLNYPKTMNTHLHIVEAYTRLYKVSGDERVRKALTYGLDLFDRFIIDRDTGHLRMFMGNDWRDHSTEWSYGHDIETAWLLLKALKALGDEQRLQQWLPTIVQLAEVCLREAVDDKGGVMDGCVKASGEYHRQRMWWVQAEGLVGFLTAYKLTGETRYWNVVQKLWDFIQRYQLDRDYGEWHWHSTLDAPDRDRDYKVGFWKGPYHNGRAMIECARLVGH